MITNTYQEPTITAYIHWSIATPLSILGCMAVVVITSWLVGA